MQRKHYSYLCHVITLPDTLRRIKPCFHRSAFAYPRNPSCRNFPHFQVIMQDGVHRSNGYAGIGSYLFHSQAAVSHNHLFHSRNHVFRSASAWPRLLRFVFTRRSAFFELSYPRTHIFHVHNTIVACLTQLLMNSDGFHTTQMEESDNHALFFERKLRHLTTVTRRCHKHSTMDQSFQSIQRVGQCCHLASPNLKNSHAICNNFHVSTCFHSREKKKK